MGKRGGGVQDVDAALRHLSDGRTEPQAQGSRGCWDQSADGHVGILSRTYHDHRARPQVVYQYVYTDQKHPAWEDEQDPVEIAASE